MPVLPLVATCFSTSRTVDSLLWEEIKIPIRRGNQNFLSGFPIRKTWHCVTP